MSLAEDLLNSLPDNQPAVASADPATEPHIVINADRTVVIPEALQRILVQHDHNIETVTFDCPRYWDGHDLSQMDLRIVFQRSDGHKEPHPVENLRIDESDDRMIHFDWTISGNTTFTSGNVKITVCAKLTNAEGVSEREWHTIPNQDLFVNEGMDCSGEEIVERNPDVIEYILAELDELKNVEQFAYFLELSENVEDAQANSDAITAAVAEHKHVILKMGDYPVKVGIIVDSGKLDLNNSRLYDVDENSTGAIIEMKGERPIVCDGEIEGSWHLPYDDPNYVWREDTQCIRVAGVNDALISNMDLHNVWGAGLATNHVYGEMIAVTHEYMEGIVAVNSGTGRCTFQTPNIDIPDGYAYVSACGNWGFNYIISVTPVRYVFYGEDGAKIAERSDTPRIRIPIPAGAKTVVIYTTCPTEELIPYYLNFTNYQENITVENTLFHHCNQAGWNNPCGPSTIRNCGFLDIGKPYPEAIVTNPKGGWGIDIEDQQCPQFIMDGCWSKGCMYMLLFGGYNGTVSNCQGDQIGAYRGWNLMLSNCIISRLYTHGNGARNIVTHSVYADRLGIDPKCLTQIHGDISTSQVCSALSRFDRFTVVSATRDHQAETASGRLIGSVSGTTTVGIAFNRLHPMEGSALAINTPGNSDVLDAVGDSWGIQSDAPWKPNGFAIRDSVFSITNERKFTKDTGAESSGLFENCEFNLAYPYFDHKQAISFVPGQPTVLTFRDCTINNDGVYLFDYKPAPGSIITFERCQVSDKEHIINPWYGNLSGVTVRFLDYSPEEYTVLTDGGTGYAYNIIMRDGALVPVCRASGIEITTPPTKMAYTVGEALDLSGMVVSVIRQDGTKVEISDYTAPAELPTDGVVAITYSEFGGTYSATFTLTISEATTE